MPVIRRPAYRAAVASRGTSRWCVVRVRVISLIVVESAGSSTVWSRV